jgi:hypothetical protein
VPEQTGLADAVIETLAGRLELTVIVIEFEVAGLPVLHTSLEVRTQVTTSALSGV